MTFVSAVAGGDAVEEVHDHGDAAGLVVVRDVDRLEIGVLGRPGGRRRSVLRIRDRRRADRGRCDPGREAHRCDRERGEAQQPESETFHRLSVPYLNDVVHSARWTTCFWPGSRENGRDLPWRRTRDPYAILVSEVMLQQTQVERVDAALDGAGSSAGRRPRRWPAASQADVIREWQGLGYNRRALDAARRRARRRGARLAGRPDDAAGRRRRTRPPRCATSRSARTCCRSTRTCRACRSGPATRFEPRERAGADGSRRDGLPRARSALRRMPAGRAVPVARPAVRAAAQAVPLRGLVPPAARERPARDHRGARARRRRGGRGARARRPRRASATIW